MKKATLFLLMFSILTSLIFVPAGVVYASQRLEVGSSVQATIGYELFNGNNDVYTFTAPETQYYRISVKNQSVRSDFGGESGSSFVTSMIYLQMEVTSKYDEILGKTSAYRGNTTSYTAKLQKGETVTIDVSARFFGQTSYTAYGHYNISVRGFDDIGCDTWEDAMQNDTNGSITSAIEVKGDKDWFYFNTTDEPVYYGFNLESIQSGGLYLDLYEYVHGAGETPLRNVTSVSVSSNKSSSRNLELKPNAEYYYRISCSGTGGYVLTTTATYDVGATKFEDAVPIDIDKNYELSIDGPKDSDYFRFFTTDSLSYYNITANMPKSLGERCIYIYNEDKELVKSDSLQSYTSTTTCAISIQLDPNSLYYFRIYGSSAGNYDFIISQNNDTFPNSMKNAPLVELDIAYKTAFDGANDSDYMFFMTSGERAYYNITANLTKSLGNRGICLYNANGEKISSSSSYSYNSDVKHSISIQLEANTVYYLCAYAEYTGAYDFKISQSKDAYPNQMEAASMIELDTEYKTTFDGKGDNDYVKFVTSDGLAYYRITAELEKSLGERGIVLYDADGERVSSSSSYSYGSSVTHWINIQLKPATVYYLRAYADNSGSYSFKVNTLADSEPGTQAEAQPTRINQKYMRDLCLDIDDDWYLIDAHSGIEKLRVSVLNESCDEVYFKIISTRDVVVGKGGGGYTGKTYSADVTLDPGSYYLCVYGDKGYYTLTLTTCVSGHDEYAVSAKAATCTASGYSAGTKCTECGMTVSGCIEIAPIAHNYVNRKCKVCGDVEKCVLHSVTDSVSKLPTCIEAGYYGGKECSICKLVLAEPISMPAMGHSFEGEFCMTCGALKGLDYPKVFSDVPSGHKYKTSVDYVVAKQLFNGTSERQFSPEASMTRAMLVTVLWRYAGEPRVNADVFFSDVAAGQWYTEAVKWAAANGIVNGVGPGKFAPDANVTREQVITILYRYTQSRMPENAVMLSMYNDGHKVSSWATDAMKWAVAGNIYRNENGYLYPTQSAPRALVANMFHNLARQMG